MCFSICHLGGQTSPAQGDPECAPQAFKACAGDHGWGGHNLSFAAKNDKSEGLIHASSQGTCAAPAEDEVERAFLGTATEPEPFCSPLQALLRKFAVPGKAVPCDGSQDGDDKDLACRTTRAGSIASGFDDESESGELEPCRGGGQFFATVPLIQDYDCGASAPCCDVRLGHGSLLACRVAGSRTRTENNE